MKIIGQGFYDQPPQPEPTMEEMARTPFDMMRLQMKYPKPDPEYTLANSFWLQPAPWTQNENYKPYAEALATMMTEPPVSQSMTDELLPFQESLSDLLNDMNSLPPQQRRAYAKYCQAVHNSMRHGRALHRVKGRHLRRAKYWTNVRYHWFDIGARHSDSKSL